MKKTFIFALVLILALTAILIGCKKSGGDEKSTQTDGGDVVNTTDTKPYDDFSTVAPGVAWSDLVPVTEEGGTDGTGELSADTEEDTGMHFIESGIELPIIPLYP